MNRSRPMPWLVAFAATLLLLLGAACGGDDDSESDESADDGATPTLVDVHGLKDLRDAQPDLQTIDVRTAEEVAEGTLPDAINISHEIIEGGDTTGIDLERPVAVICRSGRRAAIAGDALIAAGATDVTVVATGGVGDWSAAGYPTITP